MVRKRHKKKRKPEFQVGDSVVVKPGVKDVDQGYDMQGWQGRVVEVLAQQQPPVLLITWDSLTLRSFPPQMIETCEYEGSSWSSYYLSSEDIQKTEPRDTQDDVDAAIAEISAQYAWAFLGDEGKGIQKVLQEIDTEDEMTCFKAWYAHFSKVLTFPFEAEVSEFQESGPLQAGDVVRVIGLSDIDDLYGVLVHVKKKRRRYLFPLCDLAVADKKSPLYDPVYEYAVWFANR
jgi:hypothetical protein